MTYPDNLSLHTPTIEFRPDGIVCIDHGYTTSLTKEGLEEVLRIRRAYSLLPMPVMVKLEGRPVLDPKLPEVLRSAEYCEITPAVAYVTSSWQIRNLVDTYLTIQKPDYPLFVFDAEEEAVTWLLRYVPSA